ncbi:hypothetical protein [Bacillus sp. ISL-39]|uniref:ATP-dependent DNA ligase n=1 Tax=Bacillus sp. ISL-39 TaxID=2819124 RepID=UPI001BE56F35|nr:hypothetical protein [Bacillus sp. ISL-39]
MPFWSLQRQSRRFSGWYGRGTDYFNLIKEQGLEGIVLKKADAKYQINKRSNDWLKVILTIL